MEMNMNTVKESNDYKEFLDTFEDCLPQVDGVEDYGDTKEYLDENGSVLFTISEIENDDENYIIRFYDAEYKVAIKFFEELAKAIKNYVEKN